MQSQVVKPGLHKWEYYPHFFFENWWYYLVIRFSFYKEMSMIFSKNWIKDLTRTSLRF